MVSNRRYLRQNRAACLQTIDLQTSNKRLSNAIQELKSARDSQTLIEDRLRLIVSAIEDAMWDHDVKNNKVWHCDNYYRLAGYDPRLYANDQKWWLDRINPDDRERVVASIAACNATTGNHWRAEYRSAALMEAMLHSWVAPLYSEMKKERLCESQGLPQT